MMCELSKNNKKTSPYATVIPIHHFFNNITKHLLSLIKKRCVMQAFNWQLY